MFLFSAVLALVTASALVSTVFISSKETKKKGIDSFTAISDFLHSEKNLILTMIRSIWYNNSTKNTLLIITAYEYEVSKWSLDIKEDDKAIVTKYGVLQLILQYIQYK